MNAFSNPLPYRSGVGMMMINNQKKVLVARRIIPPPNSWQMPQGGIEEGEKPLEAALRELEEEIGTRHVEVIAETREWYSYELPKPLRSYVRINKYRGQRQKWFALYFKGQDDEINLNTDHPEFDDWRWVTTQEIIRLIVPFKQELYLQVIQELWPWVENFNPKKSSI